MSYQCYQIKEDIIKKHNDVFIKDLVELIYKKSNLSEEELSKYVLYFAENEHLLDSLEKTLDQIVKTMLISEL